MVQINRLIKLWTLTLLILASQTPLQARGPSQLLASDQFSIGTWDAKCFLGNKIYESCLIRHQFSSGASVQIVFKKDKIELNGSECDSQKSSEILIIKRNKGSIYTSSIVEWLTKWVYKCGKGSEYFSGDVEGVANLFQGATD